MKRRGHHSVSWKRTPTITAIAMFLLVTGLLANMVAMRTQETEPAGVALAVAGVAFVLLMVFQP